LDGVGKFCKREKEGAGNSTELRNGHNMPSTLIENLLAAWKVPRWRRALIIAALSDTLGFGLVLFPPLQWLLDAVTAGLLFVVLGFRWTLLAALAVEAVPVLELFPAWTLVVAALAAVETRKASHGAETIGETTGQSEKKETGEEK
jgi:hypothetical protein